LKQQLLLLMEELLSESLFHIPNPSAVGYSSTRPEKNNPHQPKLNLHAQKNPISAQVLGGSGLSHLRTSIGTCFIASPPPVCLSVCVSQPSVMMMIPMTENHIRQQQRKSELQLLLFSWSFGYFLCLLVSMICKLQKLQRRKKRKKQAADIQSFPGHATSQKKRTPHLEESSAAILLPQNH
jgi:hypothetical protein